MSKVLSKMNRLHASVAKMKGIQNFRGAVMTPIINKQNLKISSDHLFQYRQQSPQQWNEIFVLIINRQDNRNYGAHCVVSLAIQARRFTPGCEEGLKRVEKKAP